MNSRALSSATAGIAEIGFEQLTLAIPLADLHSLEPVLDVVPDDRGGNAGSIAVGSESCPVYCLTDELGFDSSPARGRRICAIIDDGATAFGLICSTVVATPAGSHATFGMPPCMHNESSPLEAMELLDDRVLYRSSGASLGRYLARYHEAFDE
jgi:hypothetical protein